ncbi:alpha/beta hydrolase fold domain-containing protein [Curtobacterium sp. ISL-83]|uniref:alpha/beta hydrolase fold domain-containing protein n=1 Tax=Curtobacterium sp. ISL-83 TaxID=2819145 RepID=UPI001BE8F737|nr:alpha/beta hydrolase fold domain-containing protein [Curtobacterium sp. ISL-83]MBT2503360.1 alpha/beta hydrolase fold domain-containing protein [Curtobacterium sp. ISL-83]
MTGPVVVRDYEPPARLRGTDVPSLVWLHGGGFFAGGLDQPESHAVALAVAGSGVSVSTVQYRLAPLPGLPWVGRRGPEGRRRFPQAHDDVLAAYESVGARASAGVVVGGASAGACLAAGAAAALARAGAPPRGAVLAYGFFHRVLPRGPGVRHPVRGHRRVTHAPAMLDLANRSYAGRATEAFAGDGPLGGFPRTLMLDAERDAMRASADRFAADLGACGVTVDRDVLPGSVHAFLDRPGSAAFAAAVPRIGEWIRSLAG